MLILRSRVSPIPPQPVIPTDYVFYDTLSSNASTAETGQSISYEGTFTPARIDTIPCVYTNSASSCIIFDTGADLSNSAPYSVSMWLNVDDGSQSYVSIYAIGDAVNGRNWTGFGSNSNASEWSMYDYSVTLDNWITLNREQWYHLCYVYDGSTGVLYIDGEQKTSTAYTSIITGGVIKLTRNPNYSSYGLKGYVSTMRVYERVLTAGEIQALASEYTPAQEIKFNDQSANFIYTQGASTYTLVTNPTGCTFSIASGTLPSGVTLNASTGVLSYDGSVISQDSTTTVQITASKTGYSSYTATITINKKIGSNIPTDYILYAPLSTDTTPTVGTFVSAGSSFSFATAPDGTPALYNATSGNGQCLLYDVANRVTGNSPITLSGWFYDTTGNGQRGLMGLGAFNSTGLLSPEYKNSKARFSWGESWQGSEFNNYPRPSANAWHHIAITFDTSVVRWYTDGVLGATSGNASSLSIGDSYLWIGATKDETLFVGYMRNFLVYDRALDADEIYVIYAQGMKTPIPTDYVLYAPLHDDFTAVVGTYAGKGDNWSIDTNERAAYNSFFVDSAGNYAIKYNPSQNTIYGSNPRTMSIWYKPEVSNVELNTIGYGNTGNLNCILGCIFARTKIWVEWANSWASFDTGIILDTNEWHLMTITYGGANTTIKAYVDGDFVGETSSTLTYNTSQTNVFVGTRTYDGRPFRGWLCEARVYDRELTSTEIANLYAYGNGIDVTSVRFNGGSTIFVNGIASSLTLRASPSGCTFSTSSTLPAGVTLSSAGVLAYDGITPITQDTTLTIPVTASKTGLESATANVTVALESENTIPTDYVFYAPLSTTTATNAVTGQELSYLGSPQAVTFQGIECIRTTNGGVKTVDTGINMGTDPISMCFWEYGLSGNNWNTICYLGTDTPGHKFSVSLSGTYPYGNYSIDLSTYHYESSVSGIGAWHCVVLTRSGSTYAIYIDGVLNKTYTNSSPSAVSSGKLLIGAKSGEDAYLDGYIAACRIYNRVLTAEEIALIAQEFTPQYEITAQDLSCSFYQKNETYGISYTSPAGTPTFEIVSGELPSTITFNTSTGQFSGKGLTDADHVYNLVVRLTAPNSTPATCNVTIHTYMTARISITGKTFSFYTDGSESGSFSYTSDESVTFAIESGYALPSGITLSGNTFHSDGTTTAGSYSVKVRGTSAHNQTGVTATMYFNVTANAITVTTTELKFYVPKGVTSKQVSYTTSHFAITPVYTLTGTLPSGVTFDSTTGTFTSDGTQSADETASVSVTVASSTGLSTAGTGTVSIQVYTTAPAVPDDYIFYAPLKTDETPEVGTFVQTTSNWTFTTAPDGTPAAYNSDPTQRDGNLAGFKYTGSISSTDSMTCSIWSYCTRAFNTRPPDWLGLIGAGNKGGSGVFFEWGYAGGMEIPWITSSGSSLRPSNDAWHHIVLTYERGGHFSLYVDGVNVWTSTSTHTVSIGSNNLYVGTRFNDGRPWVGYLRNAIIYNRVLTTDEIEAIYNEGID